MADSLLTSLLNSIDRRGVAGVAGALGEPEQSVWRGMQSSIATVLGGLASKSEDPSLLRRILDLFPGAGSSDITSSQMVASATDANSPIIAAGKRVLSGLFGASEATAMNAVGRESNLPTGKVGTLMAMCGGFVINFLSKMVREQGMSMTGLASLLQRESASIRSALPAGLSDIFWPRAATATAAAGSPVIAQSVERERHYSYAWIPLLALAALVPGLLWLFSHGRRPVQVNIVNPPMGTASRMATEPRRPIAENIVIRFDTGSSTPRPESQEQIARIATILKADPSIHMRASGFTDNVGSADKNMQLSEARAQAVVAELERQGVPSGQLVSDGHGAEDPVASNGTADGRAMNRRVTVSSMQ
jgi:OmpA-OmpF porin, OOP family